MGGPLTGLKVVEMVGLGPGPFCSMLLSDLGADVVRIDRKGKKAAPIDVAAEVSARGKRSIGLDLKAEGAAEAVLSLIDKADALVEGFRPGVMERLGLGPDVCLARNPKLVYGRMTGWGQSGPMASTAGHDINYIALSGTLNAIGPKDLPPPPPLNLVGDFGGGGMLLALGIVSALWEASRSGKGQVVDAAMTDGSSLLASMLYGYIGNGRWRNERGGNFLDGAAHFYGTYTCSDGKFMSVGSIEPQFYAILLEKLGFDPAEFEPQMDRARWPEFKERIAAAFAAHPRDYWAEVFDGTDACVAPILDWEEAPKHPHNVARETFIELDGVTQPAPAPRFSRTQTATPTPPCAPGADTEAALSDWGLDADRIAALRASGAI